MAIPCAHGEEEEAMGMRDPIKTKFHFIDALKEISETDRQFWKKKTIIPWAKAPLPY
jgi:hypothetical protein